MGNGEEWRKIKWSAKEWRRDRVKWSDDADGKRYRRDRAEWSGVVGEAG